MTEQSQFNVTMEISLVNSGIFIFKNTVKKPHLTINQPEYYFPTGTIIEDEVMIFQTS